MADQPDLEVPAQQQETAASIADAKAALALRTVLADTYTFVRSAELNKTIASFTFDHYIDEAKRQIKVDRILSSASDSTKGVGTRPAQLTALTTLQTDFNNMLTQLQALASKKDAGSGSSGSST